MSTLAILSFLCVCVCVILGFKYKIIDQDTEHYLFLDVWMIVIYDKWNFVIVRYVIFAGSLEAAYSLNWGAREIWGKGGGETLAPL